MANIKIYTDKFMKFVKNKVAQSPRILILDTFTMCMNILLCKSKQTRSSNFKRWNYRVIGLKTPISLTHTHKYTFMRGERKTRNDHHFSQGVLFNRVTGSNHSDHSLWGL